MAKIPLATTAPHRLLAWPRFDQPAELERLARQFGAVLAERQDACLCLRHDATVDVPLSAAVQALDAAFTAALGASADLEVLLVDNPLDEEGWRSLGAEITGVLALPSSSEPVRASRLALLGHTALASAGELRRCLRGEKGPKVTALVSTYKSAVYMRGCLEDLVAQTLYAQGQLEILVIDSGSPENEGEIVREMQQRYPDIRYVRTERETLYASWNRGIGLARGEYLTSANTDDRHRPDALEVLARHLDANPDVAVAYADALITNQPNETFAKNSAQRRLNWPPFTYAELQRRCIVGPQPVWRRSLHDRWGLFDGKFMVSGDYDFWLRIGREERIELVPQILGLYFENRAGLEWGSGRTGEETLEVMRRHGIGVAAPAPAPAKKQGSKPMVSVIVPTFNRPDFLRRALTSLTQQTFRDFEVVVVNDAGEPLEAVLQPFWQTLAINYVRHASNRDRAAARNTALGVARGTYIAYLDDDDSYRPDHLQTLVEALQKGTHKVAYTNAIWVLEQRTAAGYEPVRPVLERSMPFNRDQLMISNYIPILSVMHERACLDEVGLFDETLGTHEDWELFIRLALRYPFLHIPKVTADISWREDGTSTTSGNAPDFTRTMRVIHQRFHHLVKDNPRILSLQAQISGSVSAPAHDAVADVLGHARAQVARGDLDGACKTLSASLDLAPQSADLLLTLADVFAARGQGQIADQVLEQAGILHPTNAAVRSRLQAQAAR